MRRAVLIAVLLAVVVVAAGCGGGGGILPNAEVNAVFDRIEQGVVTKNSVMISQCFAPTFESVTVDGMMLTVTREQYKEAWDLVFSLGSFPRYEIRDRQIVFQGSDRAVVTATIYVEIMVLGEWDSSTELNRWTLQRISGQWLIVKTEQLA